MIREFFLRRERAEVTLSPVCAYTHMLLGVVGTFSSASPRAATIRMASALPFTVRAARTSRALPSLASPVAAVGWRSLGVRMQSGINDPTASLTRSRLPPNWRALTAHP